MAYSAKKIQQKGKNYLPAKDETLVELVDAQESRQTKRIGCHRDPKD